MQPAKRIEIIANSLELTKILAALDRAKAPGYTVIRNATGRGSHGSATDDLESTTNNVYILVVCPPELLEAMTQVLQPIFQKFGGFYFISDVQANL